MQSAIGLQDCWIKSTLVIDAIIPTRLDGHRIRYGINLRKQDKPDIRRVDLAEIDASDRRTSSASFGV